MIGELPEPILMSVLETLPVEFAVVDANGKVLAWNKQESRAFKRPANALGRNVRDVHPKEDQAQVEQIMSEMKSGKRDKARFWIDMELTPGAPKQKMLIEYFALRDSAGNYLGCLEANQNIAEIQKLEGQRRVLDSE